MARRKLDEIVFVVCFFRLQNSSYFVCNTCMRSIIDCSRQVHNIQRERELCFKWHTRNFFLRPFISSNKIFVSVYCLMINKLLFLAVSKHRASFSCFGIYIYSVFFPFAFMVCTRPVFSPVPLTDCALSSEIVEFRCCQTPCGSRRRHCSIRLREREKGNMKSMPLLSSFFYSLYIYVIYTTRNSSCWYLLYLK